MTRKECIELLDSVNSKNLFTATVFWRSPLTGKIDERHIYANDSFETRIWAVDRQSEYDALGVDYLIYLGQHAEYYKGTLFTKDDCYDE